MTKVVHLSTADTGGAALAAVRLHEGLLQKGVGSTFLCLHRQRTSIREAHRIPKRHERFWERGAAKIGIPLTQERKNMALRPAGMTEVESVSFPRSDYRHLDANPFIVDADIVNLHWVSGLLDFPTFFRRIRKPVVWTLHDMNPFMGGFHYEGDYLRNREACETFEEALRRVKVEALRGFTDLTCVAPSQWLAECSRKSDVLGRFRHEVVPYGLDTSIFRPHSKEFARDVFGLPGDRMVLGFASESLRNHRKGFDLLLDCARELRHRGDLLFVAVGSDKDVVEKDMPVRCIGEIRDERLMALFYSAIDAFVLPTREDNLPNVILESLACGTPVVASAVGGVPEAVRPELNGILAAEPNASALRAAIELFLAEPQRFRREAIRKDAVERFDISVSAERYVELYASVL